VKAIEINGLKHVVVAIGINGLKHVVVAIGINGLKHVVVAIVPRKPIHRADLTACCRVKVTGLVANGAPVTATNAPKDPLAEVTAALVATR